VLLSGCGAVQQQVKSRALLLGRRDWVGKTKADAARFDPNTLKPSAC
jgi:hypothetical protein